jgi:hypothetical protein
MGQIIPFYARIKLGIVIAFSFETSSNRSRLVYL